MSGGNKNLVFNTRERAVSSDVNRQQAFGAFERAELFRYLFSPGRTTPLATDAKALELGGYVDTTTAIIIGTPAVADVFEGLVVLPQAGTLNLLVSPGAIGIIDPDGQTGSSDPGTPSPDDSAYKIVNDPGILTIGALVIAAGAGSTRVDLVECRRQTVVLETDSRDIFDPSTGVFVPVTVTKVKAGRLLYRVTQGTPGGGIPARSQGWTPLMVASVPSSATTVDTMTFWDVRPLVRDRVVPHSQGNRFSSSLDNDYGLLGDDSDGTHTVVNGIARTNVGMYKAGGLIIGLDARDPNNQAAGYSPTTAQPWYLYAVFPANLPRWVKYQTTPPLIPSGPLGVLTVSNIGPPAGPEPVNTPVNPPPSTGIVTSGPAALLAASSYITGVERGFVTAAGGMTYLGAGNVIAFTPASVSGSSDFYDIVSNTKFPRGAKSLLLEVNTTIHNGGGGAGDSIIASLTIALLRTSAGVRIINLVPFGATFSSPTLLDTFVTFTIEVPLIPYPLEAGFNGDAHLMVDWNTTTGTRGSSNARIYGWRL